ncbi:DUF58 domain-containing protein [Clostridium sp.]|uniref:DUF58 domain-containing protein n=1 Tax=Clostridium sp. TaxID=1506 RepID=UPI0032168DBE
MILQTLFLAFIVIILLQVANITTKMGYRNLKVNRELERDRVTVGEEFTITTKVENNKKMPVLFLIIEERIPAGLRFVGNVNSYKEGNDTWHICKYSMGKFQRKTRIYTLIGDKRGAYIIKSMNILIGDVLGMNIEKKEIDNYIEVLVYPKIKSIGDFKFDVTNFLGNNTVRRWIHKDPLYIKGIREYNVEDRMKDIHWKTSLKANKLMVKDYDYTSEQQMVIILNTQCGDPCWNCINEEIIEKSIDIAVALAARATKESIPTGIWSNCHLIYCDEKGPNEIAPKVGNFNKILEYCTRVYMAVKYELSEYLKIRIPYFDRDCTYVLITSYLNERDIAVISALVLKGYKFKIIDVSKKNNIEDVKGVEKISYKGDIK